MEKYSKCLGRLAHGGCLVSVVCSEGTDDGEEAKLRVMFQLPPTASHISTVGTHVSLHRHHGQHECRSCYGLLDSGTWRL